MGMECSLTFFPPCIIIIIMDSSNGFSLMNDVWSSRDLGATRHFEISSAARTWRTRASLLNDVWSLGVPALSSLSCLTTWTTPGPPDFGHLEPRHPFRRMECPLFLPRRSPRRSHHHHHHGRRRFR